MSKPSGEQTGRRLVSTEAVHGGEARVKAGNAITTPISQTATYTFANTAELRDYFEGRIEREEYGRYGNPTQRAAEAKCAALDHAEAGLLFSSGMAAITTSLFAMLSRGAHVIVTDDAYRRTRQFLNQVLRRYGVEVSTVPAGNYERIEESIRQSTRLIFSESPTNPYNRIVDLESLVEIARKNRVKTMIDSTFSTPINQQPLDFGIDLVIHSATKYLGGHNDLLAGVVVGSEALVGAVRDLQGVTGAVPDPFAAYLLIRGIKTLALRVTRQNENAQQLAEFLEAHPKVERVHYPGLRSHPEHEIAKRQMRGYGGVVAFEIKGDIDAGSRLVDACTIPLIAPSLGGVESLIEQPALMSFYELSTEERLQVGIKDSLIRYSVGIEDGDDLVADIEQALRQV